MFARVVFLSMAVGAWAAEVRVSGPGANFQLDDENGEELVTMTAINASVSGDKAELDIASTRNTLEVDVRGKLHVHEDVYAKNVDVTEDPAGGEIKAKHIKFDQGTHTCPHCQHNGPNVDLAATVASLQRQITEMQDASVPGSLANQLQAADDALNLKQNEISASNRLDATMISNGYVSNANFDHLRGATSNIQGQLNALTGGRRLSAKQSIIQHSDRRLTTKWRIFDGEDALAKISVLRTIGTHESTDSEDGERFVGFVAQEIQQVLPEAVDETPDGNLSVKHQDVFIWHMKATQRLKERVMSIEEENAQLKARLALVEEEIKALKLHSRGGGEDAL